MNPQPMMKDNGKSQIGPLYRKIFGPYAASEKNEPPPSKVIDPKEKSDEILD